MPPHIRATLEAEAAGMGGGSTGDSDAGNSEQSNLASQATKDIDEL